MYRDLLVQLVSSERSELVVTQVFLVPLVFREIAVQLVCL